MRYNALFRVITILRKALLRLLEWIYNAFWKGVITPFHKPCSRFYAFNIFLSYINHTYRLLYLPIRRQRKEKDRQKKMF